MMIKFNNHHRHLYNNNYNNKRKDKQDNDNHIKKYSPLVPRFFTLLFSLLIFIVLCWIVFLWLISNQSTDSNNEEYEYKNLLIESKKLVLVERSEAQTYVISDEDIRAVSTKTRCNHYNCFDVYRCGDELLSIYIYPVINYVDSSHSPLSSRVSSEFWDLIKAIVESPYYTNDPEKACVYVPNLDLLSQSYVRLEETSQMLASLSHWNDGKNHIIFNMIPGSFPDYNTILDVNMGHAMIAGGGFNIWTYRKGFDISIPVYSPYSEEYRHEIGENQLLNKKRDWFIVSTQFESTSPQIKDVLIELEQDYSSQILILKHRCLQVPWNQTSNNKMNDRMSTKMCNEMETALFDYPQILTNATFCLLLKSAYLGHPLLSDILMSGCVAVIVSDEYVLPFQERIDWNRVSIRINQHSLPRLFDILKSVSLGRISQIRADSLLVWNRYFSSMKNIAMTTLEIINQRLFPHSTQSRDDSLPGSFDKHLALVNAKLTSKKSYGFTAVILTYDRLDSLYQVIRCVTKVPSCVKIVLVWNNQQKNPPSYDKWPKINIPFQIIQTKHNKLSNRFFPYQQIGTDAILAIDDDIVMLTPDELEFGYQVWREFPDRIVGFPSRVHRWDNVSHKWKYESEWTNDVSMVLTGAAFYHKYYNYLYTYFMPNEIKSWVDEKMNCEDIAMNFLVSNITGKAPIKVTPRKKFKCPKCTNTEMLSFDVVQHLNERSNCINHFASFYNYMPLKTVEFRADPLLYMDNLPEKIKKYNSIGSL